MGIKASTTAVIGGTGAAEGPAAGVLGLVRLHPWSGAGVPEVIRVPGEVVVGRDDDCDVAIDEESVSWKHVRLRPSGLFLEMVDLGSTNGTFIGERRIEDSALTRPGEVVRFARCVFLVVADAEAYRDWWRTGSEGRVVGGPAMLRVREMIERFGPTPNPVLITGETGTGKEVVAAELHRVSNRQGPFVPVNCAAVPEQIFEDQFFGHKRGAFTGAERDEQGYFRAANRGTLLLDEVGDLGASAQAKLLRVLETQQVVPLGSAKPERLDVRVVSATNRDLGRAVASGAFRADLYARLRVLTIGLPPLRDRPEDVILLARHLLRDAEVRDIAFDAVAALARYSWPANVRELRNVLMEAVAMAASQRATAIGLRHLRPDVADPAAARAAPSRRDPERRTLDILDALRKHKGNVTHVAEALGLQRAQIYLVLRRIGQKAEDFREG